MYILKYETLSILFVLNVIQIAKYFSRNIFFSIIMLFVRQTIFIFVIFKYK